MTEAVESQHSRSRAQWWNKPRSLRDIAEHLELTFKDEQSLERKLNELAEENRLLAAEIEKLRDKPAVQGRHEAAMAVRERLLKDEFERKTQELQLEMKKDRRQLVERVEQLKQELAGCFCRQHSNEYVVHVKKGPEPKMTRPSNRAR